MAAGTSPMVKMPFEARIRGRRYKRLAINVCTPPVLWSNWEANDNCVVVEEVAKGKGPPYTAGLRVDNVKRTFAPGALRCRPSRYNVRNEWNDSQEKPVSKASLPWR